MGKLPSSTHAPPDERAREDVPVPATPGAGAGHDQMSRRETAPRGSGESLREAAREVILAVMRAMTLCLDRYGPEGFRPLFFGLPILVLGALLSIATRQPGWVTGLSFGTGTGLAVGFSALRGPPRQ